MLFRSVVLRNEHRPRPDLDGIKAIVPAEGFLDYWALKRDGRFYFMRGGEEDRRFDGNVRGKYLYIDTKIRRITETFIYLHRLYIGLGMKDSDIVEISLIHYGLTRRVLKLMDSGRIPIRNKYECLIHEVQSTRKEKLGDLLSNIKELVLGLSNEVFGMFDYYAVPKGSCDDIIDKFISKKG